MTHVVIAIQILAGLAVGAAVAGAYFLLLRRQVDAIVSGRRTLPGGYFLRMIIIAAGIGLMLWWNLAPGIAAAVGFFGVQRIALAKLKRATQQHEPGH